MPIATPKPARAKPSGDADIGAGVDALQKTLRQAEQLGGASAEALKKARGSIEDEVTVDAPSGPKVEPGFMSAPLGVGRPEPAIEPPVRERKPKREKAPADAVRAETAVQPQRSRGRIVALAAVLAVLIGGGAFAVVQREQIAALFASDAANQGAADETADNQPPDTSAQEGLEPKILDRLPQNGEAPPAAPDAKAVATERVAAAEPEPGTPPPPSDTSSATATPSAPAASEPATPPVVVTPTAPEPVPAAEPAPTVADSGTPPGTETPPTASEPSTEPPPAAITPPPATSTTTEPADAATATPPAADAAAATTPVPPTPEATPPATAAPSATPAAPAVIVAQRAILYEEPIPGSDGARVDGQVLWALVNEPVLPGEAPVPQIRATVEVPDRKLKLVLSLRRNTDAALPASHIAELRFDLPADFPGRGIDTTPGLILKQTEDARGDPLIGAVAKVSDNLFWLALSGADQDGARNIGLLKEREWIDVPIRYLNRRRAILTFEKGTPGAQVFAQALQAWGQ